MKILVDMPEGWAACGDCNFSHNLTSVDCDPNKCPLANSVESVEVPPIKSGLSHHIVKGWDVDGNPVTLFAVRKQEDK